jgi:hypothetical protein
MKTMQTRSDHFWGILPNSMCRNAHRAGGELCHMFQCLISENSEPSFSITTYEMQTENRPVPRHQNVRARVVHEDSSVDSTFKVNVAVQSSSRCEH